MLLTAYQRVRKQLLNAQEKLDRAVRHAQEKRNAGQQTIERLQAEYEEMVAERRDNDKEVEEYHVQEREVQKTVRIHSLEDRLNLTWPTQMAQHVKQSESELNELLTEYWKLRHEAGRCILPHYRTVLIKHSQTCIWKLCRTS